MRAYSIFDDFGENPTLVLTNAGVELVVHPAQTPRPSGAQLKKLLEEYDCLIIGTGQKISADMFEDITEPRIIATASVGTDHICIPEQKRDLITVVNTPRANAQAVAEYTVGCALHCCKRIGEGAELYMSGKDKSALFQKPEDLAGKTLGVIGAGNISRRIMEYGSFFGMDILCWTRNPHRHISEVPAETRFVSLEELVSFADIISVNLPNNRDTQGLVSGQLIEKMKDSAVFISISRAQTVDVDALFAKAMKTRSFYVCLDIDADEDIAKKAPKTANVVVTPHIAGGTLGTRKRMFLELAEKLARFTQEKPM